MLKLFKPRLPKTLGQAVKYMNKHLPDTIKCYTVEEVNAHPSIRDHEDLQWEPDNYVLITDDMDITDPETILGTAYTMELDENGEWEFLLTTYPEEPILGVELFLNHMGVQAQQHYDQFGKGPRAKKKRIRINLFDIFLVCLLFATLLFYFNISTTILDQCQIGAITHEKAIQLRLQMAFLEITLVFMTLSMHKFRKSK